MKRTTVDGRVPAAHPCPPDVSCAQGRQPGRTTADEITVYRAMGIAIENPMGIAKENRVAARCRVVSRAQDLSSTRSRRSRFHRRASHASR
jgi:hypothetical protein